MLRIVAKAPQGLSDTWNQKPRLPYLSASGLAKDNYPKLQPEIPQLTLRQIPENMENGCAAQLKQLAKQNIVQVIKQYYIQWASCTLG